MRSVILLVAVLSALAAGCGRKQPLYAAPAQLAGQVNVDPYRVYISGPRIYVQTNVTNNGSEPIVVRRDAWALRLASGETLGRSTGITSTHAPYTIQPGETRQVFVDFLKKGVKLVEEADGAVLLVQGVSFGKDPTPRAIGEIPISRQPIQQPVATEPVSVPATNEDGAPAPAGDETPASSETPQPLEPAEPAPRQDQAGDEQQPMTAPSTRPVPTCVPGRSVECAGPGGCAGFQVCAADGTRFEPCQCSK